MKGVSQCGGGGEEGKGRGEEVKRVKEEKKKGRGQSWNGTEGWRDG